ncbi:hypothetical protein [Agromyces archimandritae]|uniref:Uncharacterized protein n=1 Tax=Agromyces archimandritae TaxID=2781962 RepID=A0A975FNI6_9MICO|nr:hypothetical protein [Agromyces archimandritae]QTX04276.1 hypothetical protein G127AT_13470 [Agromyces archimandritae]
MELLFIALGGAILGLAARYLLPRRRLHGVVLLPAAGAAIAMALWVALTWLGWAWDGGWIWAVVLVVTGLAVAGIDLLIGPMRERADEARFDELVKHGVAHA